MYNQEVLNRTLDSYEVANDALLTVWDQLSPETRDIILKKQQNRLEQIADRMYHEERFEEAEVIQNTLVKYAWANQYLSENWDTLPNEERLNLMRKQWNRLEELRKRNYH